ncbi:hypothetical protein ABL78_6920 [Leptomonas seymouri]|uniref:RNA-directed DNA polymerase from mobile element jockey n=1 Tax=Leptomonas seymouri TaxID=5684 RepID=A0A0N1PAK6_LEPSE|nr:hypothetical protein ABL78_6920 [Leptomonas seymouri]|eukprot:KPI84035.1 hypothetical protein ABL78_6920 [Leptomonas seymouri]
MPPPASVTASLHRFMDTLRGYPSIFCGDINLQHPSWWTSAEQSDDADRFVALMEDSGFVLENVPDTPTYYQRTTHSALDVTWSRNITIENWCANPTVDSDHKYLTYAITLVRGVLITPSIPTFSRLFYSWKRANWGHFSAEVLKALKPLGPMSLDAYLMQFTSALRCATKRSCPHGCRTKGVTRWSHEMDTADKAAVTAQEAYFATPNAETLRTYQMCKDARARIIREALKDTWHRRISKADPGSSAPWSMLRAVRAAPTIPLVNQALSSSDGQTADTHRRKLRLLAKALFHRPTNPTAPSHFHHSRLLFFPFKAMLTPESLPSPSSSFSSFFTARSADTQGPPASTSSSSFFSCEDIPGAYALSFLSFPPEYDAIANWMATNRVVGIDSPFTMAEMDAALARLEDSRSAGPDGILNEMLHHLPREAKVHLLTLINRMWLTHHVPQQWKNAHAVPLPKAGKPTDQPSSYRSISLTSCVSKLMERMVSARLLHVWQPHPCQYAYRRGRTTEMELARITDTVEIDRDIYYRVMLDKRSGKGQQVHYRVMRTLIILVDFSKAFDTLDLSILGDRLKSLPGTLLKHWLRNFLVHRGARVKLGNRFSKQYDQRSGVPQGTVLGPQLFSMYTTPLLERLVARFPDVQFDMYADDLTITIPCRERRLGVRTGNVVLEEVAVWSQDNGMMVNPHKCEALLCTLSSHTDEDRVPDPLHFRGHEINVALFGDSMSPKLLGLQLDTRAKYNVNAAYVQKQARLREAQLSCLANHHFGPSAHGLRQFVSGYGDSKLLYGSAVGWGTMEDTGKNKLINQHTRLHRLVAGLPSTSDEESVLLESNSLPLHIKVLRRRLVLYELSKFHETGWARRPPPEPPPFNFRFSPVSRVEMDNFVTGLLIENGLPPTLLIEAPLQRLPYAPWHCGEVYRVSIGFELPLDYVSIKTEDDLLVAKHTASMDALSCLSVMSYIMATDGSSNVSEHCSAAAAVLLSSPFSTTAYRTLTEDCGPIACSYRTESIAMLRGLQQFILPIADRVPREQRSLLHVTDSQSLLAALGTGPLRQRSLVESEIWSSLVLLVNRGWRIHLQFVYAHVGVPCNEVANTAAIAAATEGLYTSPKVHPVWLIDLRSLLTRSLLAKWRLQLRRDTHRYQLCGDRCADLSSTDLLTGEPLTRQEEVELARIRCGEHPCFGRLFWAVRDCTNRCRWCNLSQEQATALGGPPVTETIVANARPRTRRIRETCPYCSLSFASFQVLQSHVRSIHPDKPPLVDGECFCPFCGGPFPSRKSRGNHVTWCPSNPDRCQHRVSHPIRRSTIPGPAASSSTDPVQGAPETISRMLMCRALSQCRSRFAVSTAVLRGDHFWRFLHSKQLIAFAGTALGAAPVAPNAGGE